MFIIDVYNIEDISLICLFHEHINHIINMYNIIDISLICYFIHKYMMTY